MSPDGPGERIAVVGLAGRFPGAPDVTALWRHVVGGVDSVHDYTEAELRAEGIGAALLADPAHVRAGGRLTDVDRFDAGFFGFDPAEAARTDPQHRLFLQESWHALEDAGWDPATRSGQVGVFASVSVNRYFLFHLFGNPAANDAGAEDWEGLLAGPHPADYLPAQVAYRLGLTGPAVAVQATCAGSLVAVCLAAQSLNDLRCDVALAGGVSVVWPRHRHTRGGLVSSDGRCRAFDVRAAGCGFGSGVGVVALRRLDDAIADGDQVYAVLRGWAVTNDGAARPGFAAPGVDGQAATIAEALAIAEAEPDQIGLVEAHGTGTPLGDGVEVAALTRAYRAAGGTGSGRCALGTVKANVGHLDAAAGVTGLIKAVLAVRHGIIPEHPHFTAPHPQVALAGSPFHVPVATVPWPAGPRLAGVSAFGVGGTNAHVVVAAANPTEATSEPAADAGPWLVALSARSPHVLVEQVARLHEHLLDAPDARVADVAATLARRRVFAHRAAVVAADTATLIAALDRYRIGGAIRNDAEAREDDGGAAPDDEGAAGLDAVARAWCAGARVDLAMLPGMAVGRRIPLPGYPFARDRHWIDAPSHVSLGER
jgi:acyl transferase domain-containing protein